MSLELRVGAVNASGSGGDLMTIWNTNNSQANSCWLFGLDNGKLLGAWIQQDNVYAVYETNATVDLSGSPLWIKTVFTQGQPIAFYASADRTNYGTAMPVATLSAVGNSPMNVPTDNTSFAYQIAGRVGGGATPGSYYRAVVTINGNVTSDVDFSTAYVGDSMVNDAEGRTFTLHGNAAFAA